MNGLKAVVKMSLRIHFDIALGTSTAVATVRLAGGCLLDPSCIVLVQAGLVVVVVVVVVDRRI